MLSYSTSICFAKTLFAPIDRLRILSQVRHMPNVPSADRLNGGSLSTLSKITSEQGVTAFWRGNNAMIYRNMGVVVLQVTVFDKIKHAYMPYDVSKYQGIDYWWRFLACASMTMGLTAGLTYPLDLIHTRLTSDMSKSGQSRLFKTTFDCFNRTNIDEGFKKGLYKGLDLSVTASVFRAGLTMPLYNVMRYD